MRASKASLTSSSVEGVNQQDFKEIQVLQGCYPYLNGLQQRVPGKSIQQVLDGPIGSIYVFYQVYGRTYTLIDYGPIIIIPVVPIPITLPLAPPLTSTWFDTFDEYTPIGLLNFFWPLGSWYGGPGICQSRIVGYIDPYDGSIVDSAPGNPGPAGGFGGGSSGPGQSPTPPTPPPGPNAPQYPVDCASMPDLPSISVPYFTILSSITATQGNNNTFTDSPGGGPYLPDYNVVSVFTPGTPSGFSAEHNVGNANAYVGTGMTPSGYQYQNIAVDQRSKAVYDLTGYPFDAIFYLVGTKTLANGMLDIHGNGLTTTSCACIEIGIGGVVNGAMTIDAPLGVDWIFPPGTDGGQSKGNFGSVDYTTVRIFSSSY